MIIQLLMLIECELDEVKGDGVRNTVNDAKKALMQRSTLRLANPGDSYYIDSVIELLGPPPEAIRSKDCTGCPAFPYHMCLVCAGLNQKEGQ